MLDVSRIVVKTAGMGILDGKNVLITGVLTDASLAFGVAQLAQACLLYTSDAADE